MNVLNFDGNNLGKGSITDKLPPSTRVTGIVAVTYSEEDLNRVIDLLTDTGCTYVTIDRENGATEVLVSGEPNQCRLFCEKLEEF